MREIKFRGLTAKKEWAYGLPASDAPNSTAYYNDYSQRICWLPESGGYANVPVKNGTLCQFTGLHDKNGCEIYEGDILQCVSEKVRIHDNKPTGEVVTTRKTIEWQSEWGRFQLKEILGKFELLPCTKQEWITQFYEIIGNIYENPDLVTP